MKYFKKISGERIYLSPVNLEDIEQYTQWINDPEISDRLGTSAAMYSLESERKILESMAKEGYNFAIILKDSDRLLGNCSLFDINNLRRTAVCGLFIGDKSERGKGYGSEALRLLLGYGFGTLNLNNVMLNVFEFNKNALACYEKVGFKKIGERRQAYFVHGCYYNDIYMDILAEDFYNADK
ncbi:N-acetyltransferase [Clostridia bacterium]|nr:N-acetyltransferase [Clostridia bacterium]GHV35580.1 N-acetyltransferase [Clostridia bacterium]